MARQALISTRAAVALCLVGVGGVLLLIAANRMGQPALVGPGLLLFALGTCGAGLHAIATRWVVDRNRVAPRHTTFSGSAAVLIGVALLCAAAALGATGVAFTLGAEAGLYDLAVARPGLPLLLAGAAAMSLGASRVAGAREWRGSWTRALAAIPERLGGVFLVVLGLAALGAGVFELMSPASFDAAVEPLLTPFGAPSDPGPSVQSRP
jgi:hypothetical protein